MSISENQRYESCCYQVNRDDIGVTNDLVNVTPGHVYFKVTFKRVRLSYRRINDQHEFDPIPENFDDVIASSTIVSYYEVAFCDSYFYNRVHTRQAVSGMLEEVTTPEQFQNEIAQYTTEVVFDAIPDDAELSTPVGIGVNIMHVEWDRRIHNGNGFDYSFYLPGRVPSVRSRPHRRNNSINDDVVFIPACSVAVEQLERMSFEGSSAEIDCTICMDGIERGVDVIKMPCGHLYHSNCIVVWLSMNHICPVCRFALPT